VPDCVGVQSKVVVVLQLRIRLHIPPSRCRYHWYSYGAVPPAVNVTVVPGACGLSNLVESHTLLVDTVVVDTLGALSVVVLVATGLAMAKVRSAYACQAFDVEPALRAQIAITYLPDCVGVHA
jgi:hypothetical protein